MWPTPSETDSRHAAEWAATTKPKEKAMLYDAETHRLLARQRERELIEQAERDRLAKAAREHSRSGDTKRRGER